MKRILWRRVVAAALLAAPTAYAQQTVATTPAEPEPTAGADALLSRTVTVKVDRVSRSQALDAIVASAKVSVSYHAEAVDADAERITLHLNKQPLKAAIEQALDGTMLKLVVLPGPRLAIVQHVGYVLMQGGVIVTGRVTDSTSGGGLAGVRVSVRGTSIAVETRGDGRFTLANVPVGSQTIEFRKLGFGSFTRTVQTVAEKPLVILALMGATRTVLSGVVTTATGPQRRIEIGNDIVQINADSIVKNMPVATLTDLLATRVPGLTALRTSGSPGAPSLVRIRGLSSINASNDPIVILDGIRMYSQQGSQSRALGVAFRDDRSANLASNPAGNNAPLVTSPLDEIDPSIVDKIEVLKGPSAVALYGTDAANGVIVITSKHGVAGPATWSASGSWGQNKQLGTWSNNYWRWGHTRAAPNVSIQCTIAQQFSGTAPCIPDSLVTYQPLNDPHTTIFGTGNTSTYRADVRGGTNNFTYALSGSTSRNLGVVKLPDADVDALRAINVNVPDWQRRPDGFSSNSGQANVQSDLSPTTRVSLTSIIGQTNQRSTPVVGAGINTLQSAPPGGQAVVTNVALFGTGLLQSIPDFRSQTKSSALRFSNALNASAQPLSFLTMSANLGLDVTNRNDQSTLARGDCFSDAGALPGCGGTLTTTSAPLSGGYFNSGQGNARTTTANLIGSAPTSLGDWMTLRLAVGGNYSRTTTSDLTRRALDIPTGATSGNSATVNLGSTAATDNATAGAYIEANIGLWSRLYLQPAIRQDVGSGLGAGVHPTYPKLTVSYVLSDEPAFKRLPFSGLFNTIRLRTAYGQSGVQPSQVAKLRLYQQKIVPIEGANTTVTRLQSYGNSDLKPEQSTEWEGGFDLDFLQNRLSLTATWYQKRTLHSLVTQTLPTSFGLLGAVQQRNIGNIQNTGSEITLTAAVLQNRLLSWSTDIGMSRSQNRLTTYDGINIDINSSTQGGLGGSAAFNRFAVGYPLYGTWVRPVLGYADINQDGIITYNEMSFGDSLTYMGAPYPNYTMSWNHNISILNRFTVGANFSYENGRTQQYLPQRLSNLRAWNDPTTPLPVQAYMSAALQSGASSLTGGNINLPGSSIGFVQTVSTIRFTSLSMGYLFPERLTRTLLKSRTLKLSVQGSNLGLWSNYRGVDPNVNGRLRDYSVDTGALPQPRTWILNVGIN